MSNDPTPDLDVECNVVSEFALSMALTSESLLRYSDRMQMARSEDERAFIRKTHAELLKRTVRAHRIAFAAMTSQPRKEEHMNWKNLLSKLSHAAIIGAGVGAGVLVTALTGGTAIAALPFSAAGKAAVAGVITYMIKSARPAQ